MSTLQEKSKKLSTLRHSTAHVMAEAVIKLFPDTKVAIGPAIDYRFYYDFALPRPINQDDLPQIEKEMRKILSTHSAFEKTVITKEEALKLFKDQPFKYRTYKRTAGGRRNQYL